MSSFTFTRPIDIAQYTHAAANAKNTMSRLSIISFDIFLIMLFSKRFPPRAFFSVPCRAFYLL